MRWSFLFVLAAALGLTSPVMAQRVTNCDDYANIANGQFILMTRSRCNLAGPEWHGNLNNHKKWCLGVGRAALWQGETDKRKRALEVCGSGPIADACHTYAQSAMDQYNENVRRRCSFNDRRWHRNFGQHFNWCINVDQALRVSEMRARAEGLARCGASARYCPWCPT
jgi:hypothetical protein